jgi:sugar O-acyltransferase (sialic acid O-acetyltransferase NeuD family)
MELAIGIGAGGHAKVVVEIVQLAKEYRIAGLLDADPAKAGSKLLGVEVLGDDSLLPKLYEQGIRNAFMAMGSLGHSGLRSKLFETIRSSGFNVISAIHPTAIVSGDAKVGVGTTMMAGSIINPGCSIGDNVIINTGVVVDHDCLIGDHVHLATGARLSGGVTVGKGSHVGVGATIRQAVVIGSNAIVGAGAVVIKNVPDNVTVVGVPAKIFKRVSN